MRHIKLHLRKPNLGVQYAVYIIESNGNLGYSSSFKQQTHLLADESESLSLLNPSLLIQKSPCIAMLNYAVIRL